MNQAIRQYGPESFTLETVACARGRADANDIESLLIVQEGTLHPGGYNLRAGGWAHNQHAESREKIRQSAIKRGNGRKGTKHSPETLARMRAAAQQRVAEGRGFIFQSGHDTSEETRRRISQGVRAAKSRSKPVG